REGIRLEGAIIGSLGALEREPSVNQSVVDAAVRPSPGEQEVSGGENPLVRGLPPRLLSEFENRRKISSCARAPYENRRSLVPRRQLVQQRVQDRRPPADRARAHMRIGRIEFAPPDVAGGVWRCQV